MQQRDDLLVWIDLEMTGLDPLNDVILEYAVIITDSALNIIAEGPEIAISQSAEELKKMDEWNVTNHTTSGLIDKVNASTVTNKGAEQMLLDFIEAYCVEGTAVLCGNSVHVDRTFLLLQMPKVTKYLHYRIIDVSSFKELFKRKFGEGVVPEKGESHRALEDIRESIDELKHYMKVAVRDELNISGEFRIK